MLNYMILGDKNSTRMAVVDTVSNTFDHGLFSLISAAALLYVGTMKHAIGISHFASVMILVLGIGLVLFSIYCFSQVDLIVIDRKKKELFCGGIVSALFGGKKYHFDNILSVNVDWAYGQEQCYEATIKLRKEKDPIYIMRSNSLGCINFLVLEVAEYLGVIARVYRTTRLKPVIKDEGVYGGLMFDLNLPSFLLGKHSGIIDYFILGNNSEGDLKVVSVGYQKFSVLVLSILFSLFCFCANALDKVEGVKISVVEAWYSAGLLSIAFAVLLILTLKVVHFDKKNRLVKFSLLISPFPWMSVSFDRISYIDTDSLMIENLESPYATKTLFESRIHVPGRDPIAVAYSKSRGSMNSLSMQLGQALGQAACIKN